MRSNKKRFAALTAFSMLSAPLSTAWTTETALAKESTNKGIKSNGQAKKTIADLDAALLQKASEGNETTNRQGSRIGSCPGIQWNDVI